MITYMSLLSCCDYRFINPTLYFVECAGKLHDTFLSLSHHSRMPLLGWTSIVEMYFLQFLRHKIRDQNVV